MKIVFSDHAELKIRQRKLSRANILDTIAEPDSVVPSRGGREVLLKKFRTNYLHVIVKRERSAIVVITAHWVARSRRQR